MKQWIFRLVVLGIIVVVGFWLWTVFFPSPEHVIRQRLAEVAKLASFTSREGPLALAANTQNLASFFSNDVDIQLEIPGRGQQTVHGREELVSGAVMARSALGGMSVEFRGVNVALGPDKNSATVNLTAKARIVGERDLYVQEWKLLMKRIDGEWLITHVEPVKTLSFTEPRFCVSSIQQSINPSIRFQRASYA